MIKLICKCGHSNKEHHGFYDIYNGHYPSGCNAKLNEGDCVCWSFSADNLRYLEEKYEEKL